MTSLRGEIWKMTLEKGHHTHDKAQALKQGVEVTLKGVEVADQHRNGKRLSPVHCAQVGARSLEVHLHCCLTWLTHCHHCQT